jgi:hypothetical protein
MSRARVDLSGSSSKSSGGGRSSGGGTDQQKLIKGVVAGVVLVGAIAVVVWQLDLFGGPGGNDGVNVPSDPNAAATTPENPAPTQPTADAGSTNDGYGDDSAAAAAPPKRPERRGGGYINPDAPKDPE